MCPTAYQPTVLTNGTLQAPPYALSGADYAKGLNSPDREHMLDYTCITHDAY